MATDQFDENLDLDEALDDEMEDQDLDLDNVDFIDGEDDLDEDAFDLEDGDDDSLGDEHLDVDVDVDEVEVEGEGEEEEEEEEQQQEEEEESDDENVVDEDEEEDEETLEVLLGHDTGVTVTTGRSTSDDSGDAPMGEGEFTCRSCFLVKRRAQLADPVALICLDCA